MLIARPIGAVCVAVALISGCSAAESSVKSRASSAVHEYTNPWAAGCAAANSALRGNHDRRSVQLRVLRTLGKSPGLSAEFRRWLSTTERVLTDTDPTALDAKTKRSIAAPCQRHGTPIGALS